MASAVVLEKRRFAPVEAGIYNRALASGIGWLAGQMLIERGGGGFIAVMGEDLVEMGLSLLNIDKITAPCALACEAGAVGLQVHGGCRDVIAEVSGGVVQNSYHEASFSWGVSGAANSGGQVSDGARAGVRR